MTKNFSSEVRQFIISPDDDGIRLDRWFKRNLPNVNFNMVSRWSRTGQLRLDGKRVAPGDRIETRPKLVHRLDKDTSGVLLVARTAKAAAWFSRVFSTRKANKIYWAIVMGVPRIDHGVINLPLAKQPGTGGEKMHIAEDGQSAKTRYQVIERAGNRTAFVALQPYTGRTHQLRAHMAAIGHPIVGDGKYGGADAFLTGGISRKLHLHARRIVLPHPDANTLDVTAALPEHFANSLAALGFAPELGDDAFAAPPEENPKQAQKWAAKAHAKDRRRTRRTERRNRWKI